MTRRNWALRLTGGLAAFVASSSRVARGTSAYTLTPINNGMQVKTPDGRVVFEYMLKNPGNIGLTAPSAACFHPVYTPSGERITTIDPKNHPHHRGIWIGWHSSEFRTPEPVRADFWGWGSFAPRNGRIIENKEFKLVSADDKEAKFEIRDEGLVEGKKMMDQTTLLTVAERNGVYVLDFDYTLKPLYTYILNRTAFGGFAVQFRNEKESYFSDSNGKTKYPEPEYRQPDLNFPPAPWYDFTFKAADNGKVAGAAVVDHSANPETTWHNATYLYMLSPTICAPREITIQPNAPLRLRYRVVVHDGPPQTALVDKLSNEFRATR
jgi:Methane oxygenase PmoA